MINSLINKNYFLSKKLQKDIFAIICTKKINTIIGKIILTNNK